MASATYVPTPAKSEKMDDGFTPIPVDGLDPLVVKNFDLLFPPPPMYSTGAEDMEFGIVPDFKKMVKTLQEVMAPPDSAKRMTLKAVVVKHVADEFADYEFNVDLLDRAAASYEMACPTLACAYIMDFLDLHRLVNYGLNEGD